MGQRLDVSLLEALTFTNSSSIARYTLENRLGSRPGAKTYAGAVTNIYRCKDGRYVHFTANLPHMWRELTQNWMPDTILSEPQWEEAAFRDSRSEEASAVVAEFISGFTAGEFVAEAQRRHLSAAPLNTVGEFVDGEQLAARFAELNVRVDALQLEVQEARMSASAEESALALQQERGAKEQAEEAGQAARAREQEARREAAAAAEQARAEAEAAQRAARRDAFDAVSEIQGVCN